MGYTKLHSTILDSSVWLEPAHVRLVWITMLAMADQHGVVHASVGGLAHRARVSKEEAHDAITRFLGPDPDSRDRTTGERIEEVPGGWLVLNHANYRDKQTREQALTAERVARHRERARTVTERYVTPGNGPLLMLMPMPMESASADASVPSEPQKKQAEKVDRPDDVPEDLWQDWLDFRKAKRAPVTQRVLDSTRKTAKAAGMSMVEAFDYWIANGQTGFFPPKGGTNAKTPDGGFNRFGDWKGVPRGKQDYSVGLGEDDPEHPKQLLANENGIRASKSLPPLTMDEWKAMGDPRAR